MKATLSLDWYELNDLKRLIIQRIKRLAAEYHDTRRSYLQDIEKLTDAGGETRKD
jgi:hypothetical protein